MQKKLVKLVLSCSLVTLSAVSSADTISPYGFNFSYVAIGESPLNLHGYRTSFMYAPVNWKWDHCSIFLDASFGHWWVAYAPQKNSLNIYSLAPVVRYFFKDYVSFTPFIDLSIGPSYLTQTRLSDHNLGIHFAFQDQLGFGLAIGRRKNITISVSALHYSNGSMSSMNAGMNIPLMGNISYRF